MTEFTVRPDFNQLLVSCSACDHKDVIPAPFPRALNPCSKCGCIILVEAVVITTRTLSIPRVYQGIMDWLHFHKTFNLSQALWAKMLKFTLTDREP